MRLKIAARKSDLARIQAIHTAQAIHRLDPKLEVEYFFRESLGDQNQNNPLWQMPEKGVFTEDFYQGICDGTWDLVVHSWKDLPILPREGTEIIATLPREDARDILLVPRKNLLEMKEKKRIKILSSSPRRAYNLKFLIPELIPIAGLSVEFQSIRGNIPTRMQKLFASDGCALVVAKAALDRILSVEGMEEFKSVASMVSQMISDSYWMILPISKNPGAAAQGGLALECRKKSPYATLFHELNCKKSFTDILREREVLASHGGGCHQKIGVFCDTQDFGRIISVRGETDDGFTLDQFSVEREKNKNKISSAKLWPILGEEKKYFERRPVLNLPEKPQNSLFIAKALALPEQWKISPDQLVFTAGLESWKALAKKGIWVSATYDSLGEEFYSFKRLFGRKDSITKVSHSEGFRSNDSAFLATYELVRNDEEFQFTGKTHFYWPSSSLFQVAWERHPEIRDKWHFSGPGSTYKTIRKYVKDKNKIEVYLSGEQWYQSLTGLGLKV